MSAGGKGVAGGARKIVGAVLAIFVIMVFVPHIGTLFDLASQLGMAVTQVVGAIVGIVGQIGEAAQSAGGGQ